MRLFITILFSLFLIIPSKGRTLSGDEDYYPSLEDTFIPAMILVEDGDVEEAIASLTEDGVVVLRHRENILLTYIPRNLTSSLQKARGIRRVETRPPRRNQPMMNQARLFNNANYIAEGFGIPSPYDGKGVVVGVCDIGFDTRHPNFLTSDGRECRIRQMSHYIEGQGIRNVMTDPQEIYDWRTDYPDDWHATHVVGIAAGAEKTSGFYSLAPEADIVFSASGLSDVGLLAGVEDIIEYAKSVGKPAVINLSMGNYLGPHDGTSLFPRYLDLCSSDAIICLSAGNVGDGLTPKSMSYDFTEANTRLCVRPNDWGGTDFFGEAEVWSLDDTPFDFTFFLRHDVSASLNEKPFEPMRFEDDSELWRISADKGDPDYCEDLAKHYDSGYVMVSGGLSPLNGRYYVSLIMELQSSELRDGQAWALFWPSMQIDADAGTHVDIYCGGDCFLRQERSYPAPDNAMCISDLATGHNTISVGMTCNTDIQEGYPSGSGYTRGDVCIYSGYGTLNDGRKLPLTCAPGAYVISSISSAYLEAHPDYIQYTDFSMPYGDGNAYWIGTLGTSMSCPFVVSAIATWLQAYPNLTASQAQQIILDTNRTYGYPNEEDPRHGMGWLDAYAGIQKVLDLASLGVTDMEATHSIVKVEGNNLLIGNPSAGALHIDIYGASGLLVDSFSVSGTSLNHDLSYLSTGVYLVRVSDRSGKSTTLKIAL